MKTKASPITCSICKKIFIPVPRNKKYCSPACQETAVKAQKKRHNKEMYERSKAVKYTKLKPVITVRDIEFVTIPHGYGEYVRQPDFGIGF